jgi:NitT/TauT family transport system substrate-binding protein
MRRSGACTLAALALVAPFWLTSGAARADDTLKLAIGQMEAWSNQPAILGEAAGIFKRHGLVLQSFGTQGAGETLQAVISGAADIGVGMGTVAALRAFAKGAPVRILGASFTGVADIYWYVRADSPINAVTDATETTTIAYSTNGATSHSVVLAFGAELGVKAKPTATGGLPATLTQVMSGQIDIGWGAPPFGLKEAADRKIRIIALGSAAPSLRGQTVRVIIVNANTLNDRKDAVLRFARAYREAVDWIFADPQAVKLYAAQRGVPKPLVKRAADEFQTKDGMQFDRVLGLDAMMADGVKLKFLDAPLTKEQLAQLIQIPPP